ncbi:MAG: hypothetical protein ACREVB_10085 [Burkholderiales bacterium]
MLQGPIGGAVGRSFKGAFHDYVRGVFAQHSTRARLLSANRARWLKGLARAGSRSEQRWEGEGGSSR